MSKLFIIEKVISNLYGATIASADSYFNKLIQQYLIIFVLFLSFLILIVFLFFTRVFR